MRNCPACGVFGGTHGTSHGSWFESCKFSSVDQGCSSSIALCGAAGLERGCAGPEHGPEPGAGNGACGGAGTGNGGPGGGQDDAGRSGGGECSEGAGGSARSGQPADDDHHGVWGGDAERFGGERGAAGRGRDDRVEDQRRTEGGRRDDAGRRERERSNSAASAGAGGGGVAGLGQHRKREPGPKSGTKSGTKSKCESGGAAALRRAASGLCAASSRCMAGRRVGRR